VTNTPIDVPVPLIERWFPVAAVDEACGTPVGSGRNEKAIFTWFASRPIAQARAAVLTSLLMTSGEDPSADLTDEVERAIRTGDHGALEKLAAKIPDGATGRPVVLDCFSGRGIIPLEAARLGLRAVGIDWSPVAVLASRLLSDWPLRNWDNEPLLPTAWYAEDAPEDTPLLFAKTDQEPRLIRDLRALFAEVGRRVVTAVSPHYPTNSDGSFPWGYLWSTTIPCDGCQRRFPLVGSLVLRHPFDRTRDQGQALRLVVDRTAGTWRAAAEDGVPTGRPTFAAAEGRKGKSARCPFCGHVHPLDAVKAKGVAGQYEDVPLVAADLVTAEFVGPNGKLAKAERKVFRSLTADEVRCAHVDLSALDPIGPLTAVPTEMIAPGNADSVRGTGYGLRTWVELMNTRQAFSFVETIRSIRQCHAEAIESGVSTEYAAALASYAASNVVRRIRRSTRGATLLTHGKPTGIEQNRAQVGDVFSHESLVDFNFDWFEAGPGSGPGTWSSLTDTTLTPLATHIKGLPPMAQPGRFRRASATSLPYRGATVDSVVTDPPYYSMIDYADVSDLFYVWLRRCLFDILPDLFGEPGDTLGLQDKSQEIIVKRSPVGTDHRTTGWYEQQLSVAFGEMRRVLKPGGVLTVVFGHSDPDAWRRLLGALRAAGFVVTGAWPARTEGSNTGVASIKVTVTIGCQTAPEGRKTATAAQVEREIGELVRKRVPQWDKWDLALSDQLMASYGPSMQVVGRYRAIQRPDGTEPDLDHFLAVGRRAVVDAHAFKVDELPLDTFDPLTRFAIFWLRAFGRSAVTKGEAVFQAQSSELRIEDLRPRILADAKGGFSLTLEAPPAVTDRSSVIEAARALAGAWNAGATDAAGQVIADSGRAADDAHLWATVAELVRVLPDSDRLAVALSACQRNRRAIEVAARQAAPATVHADELPFGQAGA